MNRGLEYLVFLILVAAFVVQSWTAMTGDAQTSDEAVHLAAGVAHLRTGDRRMNSEHPPFAKLLSALPFLFLDAPLPLDSRAWETGEEWSFGSRFVYRNRLPADTILFWGRLPILLCGVALIGLVHAWARRLYGAWGGILAAAITAFEPNLIAHSHLVTNDLLLALLFAASVHACWRYRETESAGWLAAAGVLVGLTLGTKYSGVLVLPLVPFLVWPSSQQPGTDRRARVRAALRAMGVLGIATYVTLLAIYQAEPLSAYVSGYLSMQSTWAAFLLGDISTRGWYQYFLVAVLLKTPPGTLLLLVLALVSIRLAPLRRIEAHILLAAAWFFAVSSFLRINIGLRHVLPIYPLLIVFAGRLGGLRLRWRAGRAAALGLVVATAIEVALCHPFYLSYFSSVAGGPWAGYRYLSDSNLDWGQDLKRLARWAEARDLDGILLGVFSGADPGEYGLRFMPVPGFGAVTFQERPWESLPSRIVLAMSAMNLQGVYFTQPGLFRTRFPVDETLYRFLLDRPPLERVTPSIWTWDLTDDATTLYRLGSIYLNFGWDRSAVVVFRRYLELRPDDGRARRGLLRIEEALEDGSGGTAPIERQP